MSRTSKNCVYCGGGIGMHGQLIHSPWCEAPKDVPIAQSGSSQPLESAPVPVLGEAVAWMWEYSGEHVTRDKGQAEAIRTYGVNLCPLYLAPAEHITRAELEALRRDAERYRWIRNPSTPGYLTFPNGEMDDGLAISALDAAIDAAMQENKLWTIK